MNFYLTRAFAQKVKHELNNKKTKQSKRSDVSGTRVSITSNGDGKTMYSTILKWLRS